ncbi:MAG: hypothetical protein Q4F15_06005 [Bacillota bacterium]|nr:hypothetical protein [Bacillota bacterium]
MGSKLGFLLSMFIAIPMLLFFGDLFCLSAIRDNLDAASLTASYQISIDGGLKQRTIDFIKNECGASIAVVDNADAKFGEALGFVVYREYQPFVISSEPMVVSIRRSAIIGYIYS